MLNRVIALLWMPLFIHMYVHAQADPFPGTWQLTYQTQSGKPVQLTFKIANPENNLLYPARLEIASGDFTGVYDLLLLKKRTGQLAISRNKVVVSETPFSLGEIPFYLQQVLTYEKNTIARLALQRFPNKNSARAGMAPAATDSLLRFNLYQTLQAAPLTFNKLNSWPWMGETSGILEPGSSYFGITDTIHTDSPDLSIFIPDNKRNDDDTVTAWFNGQILFEAIDTRKKSPKEEATLQPGLNILALFADNYGKRPPNAGKLVITTGKRKITLDYNDRKNQYHNFLVTKIYYYTGGVDSIVRRGQEQNIINRQTLQRSTRQVGRLETRSEEITLAIWDDAVEDGDSISLNLNGKWVLQGFAVKKQPQFVTTRLQPGPNKMVFIADNLGAISPNTSVLEIIDGKQRKSFKIETNYDKNNLINIFYDYDPDR